MNICICGGRNVTPSLGTEMMLNRIVERNDVKIVIHGGCPTGVDKWADEWAKSFGLQVVVFEADWSAGKVAGPIRNRKMALHLKDVGGWLVALPGGLGTLNMVETARKMGIPVLKL